MIQNFNYSLKITDYVLGYILNSKLIWRNNSKQIMFWTDSSTNPPHKSPFKRRGTVTRTQAPVRQRHHLMSRGSPRQQDPVPRPRLHIHAATGRCRNGEQNLLFQNAADFVGMRTSRVCVHISLPCFIAFIVFKGTLCVFCIIFTFLLQWNSSFS